MLQVSRKINSLAKQVMANRLSKLCGLPSTAEQDSDNDEDLDHPHGKILLRVYSPEDISQTSVNWYDTDYVETNNKSEFHYLFDKTYCSQPSTAHNSDEEMTPSTPQSSSASASRKATLLHEKHFAEDIVAQSKFTIKSHLRSSYNGMRSTGNSHTLTATNPLLRRQLAARNSHLLHTSNSSSSSLHRPTNQVATIDIVEGDSFGQVVLQVAVSLNNSQQVPVLLFKKTQRIYSEWVHEDEYLIHNKELTCRIQVTQSDPTVRTNDFGERFQRFEVLIQELVFNTGFLLNQLESNVPEQYEMVQYKVSAR